MISNSNRKCVIDAHTHVFPDAIAAKARDAVSKFYGLPMYTTGTYQELKSLRQSTYGKWEIVGQLVCSPAAVPEQTASINTFIASLCSKDPALLGLGTLHRDNTDFKNELDRIWQLGLKGVKFHFDFQHFPMDDEKMIPIYREIARRGLLVLFHMGDKNSDYSAPSRLVRVIEQVPDLTIIAAHMGGYQHWEEALRLPVSSHLYFDLSSTLAFVDQKQVHKMIQRFGVKHFFFGSDFPMWNPYIELEVLEQMGLTEAELEDIEYNNFTRIFDWRMK